MARPRGQTRPGREVVLEAAIVETFDLGPAGGDFILV